MPARGAVALSDPKLETRVQRLSDAIKGMQVRCQRCGLTVLPLRCWVSASDAVALTYPTVTCSHPCFLQLAVMYSAD